MAERLEPFEKKAAEKRQKAGKPSENFTEGEALNKVALAVGMSRPTLRKIDTVIKAAEECTHLLLHPSTHASDPIPARGSEK